MSDRIVHTRPNVAFRRLARTLAEELRAGRWLPGQRMPSRRDLAAQYAVTPNTVNKAIQELAGMGLVSTSERHGTLVLNLGPAPAQPPMLGAGRTVALVATTSEDVLAGSHHADFWMHAIARSLESGLAEAGLRLRPFRVWSDALPDPAAGLAAALACRPAGLVVANLYGFPGYDTALGGERRLHGPEALPALVLTSQAMPCPLPQITYDQVQFGYLAGRHLIDSGYRRILVLRLCSGAWLDDRIRGVISAVRDAGMPHRCTVLEPAVVPSDAILQSPERIAAVVAELLAELLAAGSLEAGTTALVAPSDRAALAVLDQLAARGLQAGTQIGVIGFDDAPEGRARGLTTVRPPLEAMGIAAARRLRLAMAGERSAVQETLPPTLLPRITTDRGTAGQL